MLTSAKSMPMTSAPASRTSCAAAFPMPEAAPTTSARLPSKRKASNKVIGFSSDDRASRRDRRQVGGGKNARRGPTDVRHGVDRAVRGVRGREGTEVGDGDRELQPAGERGLTVHLHPPPGGPEVPCGGAPGRAVPG